MSIDSSTREIPPSDHVRGDRTLRHGMIAGLCVAIGTAVVMCGWILSAYDSPQIAWDFPMFYIAAHLPLQLLYHHPAFAAFGQRYLIPVGVHYYQPFYIRPAVFAILYRPLARLAYWHAFWVWTAAGITAYVASVLILIRRFRLPGFLLPAYAAFFPAAAGIISGQDVGPYLLLLITGFLLLENEHDALAGLAFALCLYKFNLIILVPVLLLLHRRYRALGWFAAGGLLIFAVSMVLASPVEYFNVLVHGHKQIPGFYPVGLRGFSVAIDHPWCYPVLAAPVLLVCFWMMGNLPLKEAFCVAVTGTLLISPYLSWYDSTLLALPFAVILAGGSIRIRIACVGVLVAIPLWRNGGGNNGPIGFTHVAVELAVLAYFLHVVGPLRLHLGRFAWRITRRDHALRT